MNQLISIICFCIISFSANSGIVIKNNDTQKNPVYGVPLIVYSTTVSSQKKNEKYVSSNILTVLQDGSCYLIRSSDNRQNQTLLKEEQKLKMTQYGPEILSEVIRAALQRFFSESFNWTLHPRSFVIRKNGNKEEYWISELTLKYGTANHVCYMSSTESQYPELSAPGYEFLDLLEKIITWMITDSSEK